MWKVYANRVFGLRFLSLLCRTDPWIRTRSPRRTSKGRINRGTTTIALVRLPGSQHSSTYSPVDGGGSLVCAGNCSKPVPPAGRRTKRFVIGVVKCDPGRNERAPFSAVHFSRGIQNPRADGGSVYCLWVRVGTEDHKKAPEQYQERPTRESTRRTASRAGGSFYSRVVVFRDCMDHTRVPRLGNEVRSTRYTLTSFERVLPSPPICCCFVMTIDWSAMGAPKREYNSLVPR